MIQKHINVEYEVWEKLYLIKIKNKEKNINNVIKGLIKNQKTKL